mmetsp:Transcript_88693/g.223326  ORF Transcript_88693/g.223326 Transcript_88693/m.223326 type:complete len:221 (-) Transcript_88693:398-1060(-)
MSLGLSGLGFLAGSASPPPPPPAGFCCCLLCVSANKAAAAAPPPPRRSGRRSAHNLSCSSARAFASASFRRRSTSAGSSKLKKFLDTRGSRWRSSAAPERAATPALSPRTPAVTKDHAEKTTCAAARSAAAEARSPRGAPPPPPRRAARRRSSGAARARRRRRRAALWRPRGDCSQCKRWLRTRGPPARSSRSFAGACSEQRLLRSRSFGIARTALSICS